jgi:hypothetical protein
MRVVIASIDFIIDMISTVTGQRPKPGFWTATERFVIAIIGIGVLASGNHIVSVMARSDCTSVANISRETLTFASDFCDRNSAAISLPTILSRNLGFRDSCSGGE